MATTINVKMTPWQFDRTRAFLEERKALYMAVVNSDNTTTTNAERHEARGHAMTINQLLEELNRA